MTFYVYALKDIPAKIVVKVSPNIENFKNIFCKLKPNESSNLKEAMK